MPVYLFTYHGHQSWMPDHRRGYVRRGKGYLPRDEEMARRYRDNTWNHQVLFDRQLERALVEEVQLACGYQQLRLHGAATEPTHIHVLVSWRDARAWSSVRASLKSSLSRRLNEELRKNSPQQERTGPSLSRGGSRKHVRDREHFDYLLQTYLPRHGGICWFEDRGWLHDDDA